MKQNLKINSKSYETIFSFYIAGDDLILTVPTPPPTPPPPVPTPAPISPPFPPLNIPSDIPPGLATPPPVPPYYTPQTWVEILYVEAITYRFSHLTLYADNEAGYNMYLSYQQGIGWGYSFPTDWGTTETMVGYYPSKDFVPTQIYEATTLAILSPHNAAFFTDINNPPDWYNPAFSYPMVSKFKTTAFAVNTSGPSTVG